MVASAAEVFVGTSTMGMGVSFSDSFVGSAINFEEQFPNLTDLQGSVRVQNNPSVSDFTFGEVDGTNDLLTIQGDLRFEDNEMLETIDLSKILTIEGNLQVGIQNNFFGIVQKHVVGKTIFKI